MTNAIKQKLINEFNNCIENMHECIAADNIKDADYWIARKEGIEYAIEILTFGEAQEKK